MNEIRGFLRKTIPLVIFVTIVLGLVFFFAWKMAQRQGMLIAGVAIMATWFVFVLAMWLERREEK